MTDNSSIVVPPMRKDEYMSDKMVKMRAVSSAVGSSDSSRDWRNRNVCPKDWLRRRASEGSPAMAPMLTSTPSSEVICIPSML